MAIETFTDILKGGVSTFEPGPPGADGADGQDAAVYYGTGSPPDPTGLIDGAIFLKYIP